MNDPSQGMHRYTATTCEACGATIAEGGQWVPVSAIGEHRERCIAYQQITRLATERDQLLQRSLFYRLNRLLDRGGVIGFVTAAVGCAVVLSLFGVGIYLLDRLFALLG